MEINGGQEKGVIWRDEISFLCRGKRKWKGEGNGREGFEMERFGRKAYGSTLPFKIIVQTQRENQVEPTKKGL